MCVGIFLKKCRENDERTTFILFGLAINKKVKNYPHYVTCVCTLLVMLRETKIVTNIQGGPY